jgi:hypothetical protein
MSDVQRHAREWLLARARPDRDLTPAELASLARDLAGRCDLWQPLVRHDPGARVYVQLHRDQHLDAWLICWMHDQDTGLHDHDVSSGAVTVIAGALAEECLVLGRGELDERRFGPGESFAFDASRIHQVRHVGAGPAVSLHLYSPPLWRMGYYEAGDDGRLNRRSASYAAELAAS